ncbi:TetR/AcrR family transcriptional regulator [Rhizobium hainanense]|uniref:Transcriptional regulator, TetR family n=1 Tax=Rhizobium hainanense TaxID=52131 RepID=A0A1C3VQQ6_9HYPH|nr:TetR/AcrR family transcriptional regulator [Rhizobium hainanense]SCB30038.1 transcriptional regulator, TetR family [Rhizobium hainanense]
MTILKRTERSRKLILDAADAAFRELGFAATSIEEIAGRAGLTRKTVYNLFRSKEEIALCLIGLVEAQDAGYRVKMAANENVLSLLELVLVDSASWCLANPSLARLALSPAERPSLEPPADRPSFQGLVRDILVLGQRQGIIRKDEDPNFMTLVLLGVFGQSMLTSLSKGSFEEQEISHIIRILVEGIGSTAQPLR